MQNFIQSSAVDSVLLHTMFGLPHKNLGCTKDNPNLRRKIESVTAGADATMYCTVCLAFVLVHLNPTYTVCTMNMFASAPPVTYKCGGLHICFYAVASGRT